MHQRVQGRRPLYKYKYKFEWDFERFTIDIGLIRTLSSFSAAWMANVACWFCDAMNVFTEVTHHVSWLSSVFEDGEFQDCKSLWAWSNVQGSDESGSSVLDILYICSQCLWVGLPDSVFILNDWLNQSLEQLDKQVFRMGAKWYPKIFLLWHVFA